MAARIEPHPGIIAVHLYGQIARWSGCAASSPAPRILLFEDAAQAHGARRFDESAGTVGLAAATSFYPGKNLGAYGDGGAVVTDGAELAHGSACWRTTAAAASTSTRPSASTRGSTPSRPSCCRPSSPGSTNGTRPVGSRPPATTSCWATSRRCGCPRPWPATSTSGTSTSCACPAATGCSTPCRGRGIGAGMHYPIPIHLQGAFARYGHRRGEFPHVEEAAGRILSLPLHPHLTAEQQERIAEVLIEELN